jgi:phage-related minor tail protein
MTEERRVQLVAEVDTTRTRAGFQEIGQQAGQMAQQVTQAGERAERAVSGVGSGAAAAAQSVEAGQGRMAAAVQRSTAQIEAAERNLISMTQRSIAATQAGARSGADFVESLARIRNVDPGGRLAPYVAQLRAVEQAQARTAASAGASAAQMAAAMRTVPAQFTDVVTALQGGQQPLTVLLQQGGQLRDQFGSTGAAARALGGYITGLINPYTVAAGAAIALAVAYKTGAEEASAYSRAIALTGNAAGATADQLAQAAREISVVTGSQGAAAEALVALVSTGQVSAENLQKFGAVAVQVQKVIGRSVADTATDFAELGRSPLTALDKINEKYHFITAATYAQVKALQDQGRAQEAADVAQKAYADGIDRQRQKVLDALTDWERGWIRIKGAVSGAADAVIDFAGGREATNFDKINGLLDDRAKLEENLARARKRNLPADVASYEAELEANKRAINAIRDKDSATRAAAKAEADAVQVAEARNRWLTEGDKYLSRAAQLERDVTRARNEGAAAQLSQADIDKRVSDIRKSYADIFNAGIESNIAALKRRDAVADVLTQREVARIAAERAAGSMVEDDSINATANEEIAALQRKRTLLDAELVQTKLKANSIKEQKDLLGQIDALDEQVTSRRIQRTNDLFAAEQRRYRQAVNNSAALIEAEQASRRNEEQLTLAQTDYNEQIGLSQRQIAGLTAARLLDIAAQKEAKAIVAEGWDLTGERAENIRKEAAAIRERAAALMDGAAKQERYDAWKQAVDQYGQVFQQGFADMLNHGKDGWASFTRSLVTTFKTSVADQIYNMFARPIVVQLVGSLMGISPTAIAGEIASKQGVLGATAAGSGVSSAGTAVGAAAGLGSLFGAGGVGGSLAAGAGWLTGATTLSGSLGAAGSLIATGTAGGIASGIGMAVGTVAPIALGAIVGAKLFKSAFGHGDTEVESQGYRGTLSASMLTGDSYKQLHQDGGWFSSDRNWTESKAFTDEMVKQFTQGLATIEGASSGFASSLGVQADWIKDYSKTFDLKLTGDAAKDQQLVTDFFSGIGDEIAKKLVPNLDELSKSGETASAALERLAGDFKGTDQIAQLLGFSASSLFGSTGLESAKAREQLIDLAGGLSALSSQAAFFNQNFLTDAERIKPVAEALDKALASLGLSSIPTTRDQFKALVDDLITSGAAATESGAKQLDSLLALGEVFAQVHPETATKALQERQSLQDELDQLTMSSTQLLAKQRDALDLSNRALFDQVQGLKEAQRVADERKGLQDQLDELVMSSTQLLAKQRAALDESNRSLFDQIQAVKAAKDSASAVLGGVSDMYSALQKVVSREKSAIQTSVDTHTAAFNKLQSLSQALHSTLDSLQSPEQKLFARSMAQAEIRSDLAITKAGGTLSDAQVESLKKALGAVTQDASKQFGSREDYMFDLLRTQNDIAQLGDITDDSLSIEQKSLDALNDQIKRLDAIVANGQAEIDALNGQSVATLSLAQALAAFQSSIGGAKSNPVVGGTSTVAGFYEDLLGRAPDKAGLQFWQDQIAKGTPLDAIRAAIMGSDEYKKLHPFAIGTNYVPQTMPALVHEGERIIPAADNRLLMSVLARASRPSDNGAVLADAVKGLQEENAKQREVIEGMAKDMAIMADVLKGASPGGSYLRVKGI